MSLLVEDVNAEIVEHGVPDGLRSATLDKVFWSHICQNLAPAGWVLGAIMAGIGLDVRTGLLAIVIGNIVGALPVGLCAMIGPSTGLTQIEISRFSFGRFGTRIPAALNWCGAVGWDAVNNVPSTLAFVAIFALIGVHVPFWAALFGLGLAQLTAAMYGHHVVQNVGKYLGYALVVTFAIAGAAALSRGGSLVSAHTSVTPATFVLGVSLAAGFGIGFGPYSSDYTRYLPRTASTRSIFALSFLGLISSGIAMEAIGLLTASKMTDLSPAGVIGSIAHLTGYFAPVALLAIATSSITINSYNDNTAAYSLLSTGLRIPRHYAALATAVAGYTLTAIGAGAFAQLFSNYMLVLLYWIAPWAGIVLADWYLFHGRGGHARRWAPGAIIFVVVTTLTIALFSATEVYTGPVARLLGNTDIGYFVGFFGAAGTYVAVERRAARQARSRPIAALQLAPMEAER